MSTRLRKSRLDCIPQRAGTEWQRKTGKNTQLGMQAGKGDRAVLPCAKKLGVKHSLSTFTEGGTQRCPPATISESWNC